jgi:hypothetical protein
MSGIDPTGLICTWDDGSYDSSDDASTGTAASCDSQGGTWFDNIVGDYSPDPNPFIADMVTVAQAMDLSAVSTDQQNSIAQIVTDIRYIQQTFDKAVSYMDSNGLRRPGSGLVNALKNDFDFWFTNYQACKGQSYILMGFLQGIPQGSLNFQWTFSQTDDYWHTWVESSYGGPTNIVMDPLYGTFTVVPSSYLGGAAGLNN